jgi:hypothetical protein
MGCNGGWFIATKSQVLMGKPTAFIALFLDLAKITEDTLSALKKPLTRKTTVEWDVFVLEAQEEWADFETRHPLRIVEEQLSGELIDDESMGLTKGELFDGCYLSPKDFAWKEPTKEPCPLNISKALEGAKSDRRAKDDITDLQVAVEDLAILYGAVPKALQENAVEVLDYLWLSVGKAIKAIDCLNHQVRVWKEVVDNFSVLHEDRGAIDICSKLASVLGDVDALKLNRQLGCNAAEV